MNIIHKLMLFLSLFFVSCSNDSEASPTTEAKDDSPQIATFTVNTSGGKVEGEIDEVNRTISLSGIKYSSNIEKITFSLQEGYTALNNPEEWMGTWKKEEIFILKNSNGKEFHYKVLLPDLERYDIKPYVIGYMREHNFEMFFNKLDWSKLTHVNLGFISMKTSEPEDINTRWVRSQAQKIVKIGHQHGVKVLVSVAPKFKAIETEEARRKAVDYLIAFVEEYGLDGLDIDYEDYSHLGPELLAFVKALRNKAGRSMLLTCAVNTSNKGYTEEWHNYFDLIHIMAYDMQWGKDQQRAPYEGAVRAIDNWIIQGKTPAYKLTLGLPFYGYTWDSEVFPELSGIDTDAGASQGYWAFKKRYPNHNVWELDQVGRSYYNGMPTITKKCRLALSEGLSGVMIWDLSCDDYDDYEHSLTKAVVDGLK